MNHTKRFAFLGHVSSGDREHLIAWDVTVRETFRPRMALYRELW